MADALTAVCRECMKRFPLGRRANQHRRANGSLNKTRLFCGSACKQAAYRRRSRNARIWKKRRHVPIPMPP
jgi:hypothetical protein